MLNGIVVLKVCYYDNALRDSVRCVKAARFSSNDGKNIEIMGNIVSWSKGQIIQMITDRSEKIRIFTATEENDTYVLDAEVEAYPDNGPKFVRIKGSSLERDDLDNLPIYEAHC